MWSFSVNHYDAPAPFTGKAPYTVVAVELNTEQIIVLGQLSASDDPATLAKQGDFPLPCTSGNIVSMGDAVWFVDTTHTDPNTGAGHEVLSGSIRWYGAGVATNAPIIQ